MTNIPNVTLSNGVRMPASVFGVYQMRDAAECQKAVESAIAVGYRAIDTAASYGNERAVGNAIKASGIDRSELFITTKLWVEDASEEGARRAIDRSLELLGLDYLDLYLIHQPVGDVYGAWRTMERLYQSKILRAIGVSNFAPDRFVDFVHHNAVCPHVNQIEINPFYQQKEALPILNKYGAMAEAWAPFSEGRNNLFDNPTLKNIAMRHERTVGQIVLRYVYQLGAIVIAKTVRPERMAENLNIFDFELAEEDMKQIAALDTNSSQFFSHRDPSIIEWMCSRHIEH